MEPRARIKLGTCSASLDLLQLSESLHALHSPIPFTLICVCLKWTLEGGRKSGTLKHEQVEQKQKKQRLNIWTVVFHWTVQLGANYQKTTTTKRHSSALIRVQEGSLCKVHTSFHVASSEIKQICNNKHYIQDVCGRMNNSRSSEIAAKYRKMSRAVHREKKECIKPKESKNKA